MIHYKIVVLGYGGVGKSTYIAQFTRGIFVEKINQVIEGSYLSQHMIDGETSFLDIMESPNQAEWIVLNSCFRRGQGFCFVYSITSRSSFEDVINFYEHVLRVKEVDSIPCVLIANKLDLEEQRQVTTAEGEDLAKRLSAPFLELSSRDHTRVEESIFQIVRDIRDSTIIDVSLLETKYKKTLFLNIKKKKELKAEIKSLKHLRDYRELKKQLVIMEKQLNELKSPSECPEVTVMDQCDVAEQLEKMSFIPSVAQLYIETARNSSSDVKTMINDMTTADVILSVPYADGINKEPMLFYVHKDILKSRCSYFAGMFNHSFWKESHTTSSENSTTSAITTTASTSPICDMKGTTSNPIAFQALLEFIYTDSVSVLENENSSGQTLNLDDIAELVVLANQFQLPRLKQLCERQLAKQCTLSSCVDEQEFLLDSLSGAQMYLCSQLAAVCIHQLSTPEIYETVSSKKRYHDTIQETEKRLIKEKYDAIVAYREQKAALTKQISDLKWKIRTTTRIS